MHHYTLFTLQSAPRSMPCPAHASVLLRTPTLSSKASTKMRARTKNSTWQRRFSRHENLTMSGKNHILSKCTEVNHARIVPNNLLANRWRGDKKLCTLLDLCVSSLRRGHANLLYIVPILVYVQNPGSVLEQDSLGTPPSKVCV